MIKHENNRKNYFKEYIITGNSVCTYIACLTKYSSLSDKEARVKFIHF